LKESDVGGSERRREEIMSAKRMGQSQGRILDHLKRYGSSTIPTMSEALELSVETVRTHLAALVEEGLVSRDGSRIRGRGRPEIIYGLTGAADALFPNREGALLTEFVEFLKLGGKTELIRQFFDERVRDRREAALSRVEGLTGDARLKEASRILAEEGFMPEIDRDDVGRPVLRLTHCPLRKLVDVTRAPCRAELGFVRELLGAALVRVAYIPAGDSACCYALEVAT
jgi:predicted ArsR family transcriptional regulator